MQFYAFDTETHLIQPGLLAPPLVCGSIASDMSARLLSADDTCEIFVNLLRRNDIVVGANIAYDMGVMAVAGASLKNIFAKYDRDEVYDVQIAEALNAIAGGHLGRDPATGKDVRRYSLETCVRLVLGRDDAKANDQWRTRYALLERTPIDEWPAEARQYPIDDARNTLDVCLAQMKTHRNLHDLPHQVRAAFALHLSNIHGLRTDPVAVTTLEAKVSVARAKDAAHWQHVVGFIDSAGKKDTVFIKSRMARAYGASGPCPTCGAMRKVKSEKTGKPIICKGDKGCDGTGLDLSKAIYLPRTPAGGIAAGRDDLSESGDEDLIGFAQYSEDDKLLSVYLPFLKKGMETPINPRANVLVASGRTSYDDVIQQIPREGGVRECFIPRSGFVFCSTDYASGELCTLAQVAINTVGESRMAEVINETKDPGALHTAFAARMMGISVDDTAARVKAGDKQAKSFRQAAKAANFGFPGGMGAAKFVLAKRKKAEGSTDASDGTVYNGLRLCILIGGAERCGIEKVTEWKGRPSPPVCRQCVEMAEQLKSEWLAAWPEMPKYFDWISTNVNMTGELTQFVSGRVRGGLSFCDGANTLFQGLLADGAKRALWYVTREMYTDAESPLYGSRVAAFFHDEIFSEMPEDIAHLAGPRQAELMIKGLREYTPDVFVGCQPALMRRWSKAAEPVYNNGLLIPWEPK